MNIVKAFLLFSTGFVVGAHKYHLEYYCPEILNPFVIKPSKYSYMESDYEDVIMAIYLKNERYYKVLEEKMKNYEGRA